MGRLPLSPFLSRRIKDHQCAAPLMWSEEEEKQELQIWPRYTLEILIPSLRADGERGTHCDQVPHPPHTVLARLSALSWATTFYFCRETFYCIVSELCEVRFWDLFKAVKQFIDGCFPLANMLGRLMRQKHLWRLGESTCASVENFQEVSHVHPVPCATTQF